MQTEIKKKVCFGNYSVNAQLESEFSFGAFTLLAEVNPA